MILYTAQMHFQILLEKRELNPLHAFAILFPLYIHAFPVFPHISALMSGYSIPLLCSFFYLSLKQLMLLPLT